MNDEQARSLISDVSTTINELIIQKNRNWLEAHELRVERDGLLVEIERLKRELDASVAYHAAYRSAIDDALLEPRGNCDIKTAHINEILRIRSDSERLKSELQSERPAVFALQEEINSLESKRNAALRALNEVSKESNKLKSELAAAPRWAPLNREIRGLGTRFTGNSGDGSVCEARQISDGTWRSTETRLLVTVTHVLENLNPPTCEPCSGTDCEVPPTIPLVESPADCLVPCNASQKPDLGLPRLPNVSDDEPVTPDTDIAMTTEQMAAGFDSVADRLRAIDASKQAFERRCLARGFTEVDSVTGEVKWKYSK